MLNTLSKGYLNKEEITDFRKFLSLMSSELERCGGIVSGLLSFSREPSMVFKDVDLNDVLDSVISLTHHKIQLQDINLNKEMSGRPLMMRGDVNQLQQIFLNLIFNAIEAMPDGGQLDIVSRIGETEKNIVVEIRDTGIGINEGDLNHIFDPFFTSKKEGKGTGLGLSIVYGLVKTHSGEINVKSKAGKGTSFLLTFASIS
jgi:signal transduction histidine kinase